MSLAVLHRITAWLCLAVALVAGVSPAQGFMLCVEQDGCVSLELAATADHCLDCEAHTPADVDAKFALDESRCPCVDFAMPSSTKEQALRLQSSVAPLAQWLALLPAAFAPPTPFVTRSPRVTWVAVPRPPDALRVLRGVVLLV